MSLLHNNSKYYLEGETLKRKKYFLNIANGFTWLIQLGAVLGVIQYVFWAISMAIHGEAMYSKFFVLFFYTVSPNVKGQIILSYIVVVLRLMLIIAIFLIMHYLRNMHKNIKKSQYFVIANLKALKTMLIAGTVGLLAQFLQIIAVYPWAAAINGFSSALNRNHEFVTWLVEVIFLVTLFIVYEVFASGLEIKKENNEII